MQSPFEQPNQHAESNIKCHNPTCGDPFKTRNLKDLKKCGNCRIALYCSRECQKAAWRTHKTLCEELKNSDAMMTSREWFDNRELRKLAFFGPGPGSSRLIPHSMSGRDAESVKLRAFVEKLDLGYCMSHAVEKYCTTGVKGTLLFDIDKPTGIFRGSEFEMLEFMDMKSAQATRSKFLQEHIKYHDPAKSYCITYYKLSADKKSAFIWCAEMNFRIDLPSYYSIWVQNTKKENEEAGQDPNLYKVIVESGDTSD